MGTVIERAAFGCALISLLSCSDSTLERAHAAAALHWDTSASGNQSPVCVPGAHWSNAPVSPDDAAYVSATDLLHGDVVQGDAGSIVTCSVTPQGDQYVVSGHIEATGQGEAGLPLMTSVAVRVVIAEGQEGAQGTLYITDQRSQFAFSSDTTITPPKPGCLFSVRSTGNDNLGVAPGRIWAHVQCPHIQDNRNRAKQECQISEGYIMLDHCLQSGA